MHLARIDRKYVAGFRLDDPAPAHGFLRAAQDDADPELVMGVSADGMGSISRNRVTPFIPQRVILNCPLVIAPILHRKGSLNHAKLSGSGM